jgi:hypothetical protein
MWTGAAVAQSDALLQHLRARTEKHTYIFRSATRQAEIQTPESPDCSPLDHDVQS